DLFRGDYVILRYEISSIKIDPLRYKASDFKGGDKIYVSLQLDDKKEGILSQIHKSKPMEGLFIEGKVNDVYEKTLNVEYGIESYFVPEGEGLEIERNLGEIYAKVAVDHYGKAVIKSLILEGKEITCD